MSRTESALSDLDWFANEYQSELGVKSSGSTFEALAMGVHCFSSGGHEISQRALSAAWRAGKIRKALGRVGKQNLSVLVHSYDPMPRMPLRYTADYGDSLAGICWKLRPPKGVKGQGAIKAWAQNRLDKAHSEYLKQKRENDNE